MKKEKQIHKKFSLQFYMACIFSTLLITISAILISLNFQSSKQLNQTLIQNQSIQNAIATRLAFQAQIIPALTALNIVAESNFGQNFDSEKKPSWLKIINVLLKRNLQITSIYTGYSDNHSFFVRNLHSPTVRGYFSPPPNAVLMIEINKKNGEQKRLYLDESFNTILEEIGQTTFKPTLRDWFINAPEDGSPHVTEPYYFYFIDIFGISLSRRLPSGNGVISMDTTLDSLEEFLYSLPFASQAELILMNSKGDVIARVGELFEHKELPLDFFSTEISKHADLDGFLTSLTLQGERYHINFVDISKSIDQRFYLAEIIPESVLIAPAIAASNQQLFVTLALMILGVFFIVFASDKITRPIEKLKIAITKISLLQFDGLIIPKSKIRQIDELSVTFQTMTKTIDTFLVTLHRVSKSTKYRVLLKDIVTQCHQISEADQVIMWSDETAINENLIRVVSYPVCETLERVDLSLLKDALTKKYPNLSWDEPQSFSFKDLDLDDFQAFDSAWLLPLTDRNKQNIGYVLIAFQHRLSVQENKKINFIQTFLDFISLIKEYRSNLHAQQRMFDAFVKVFASAIDTKSPYTGAHCQRVPALCSMFAEAVHRDEAIYPDFQLNKNSREALHLAAWLHDCGKVTTPDFVVDKSTKLQTIYNRIHEIRVRFEVLKRDAHIACLQENLGKELSAEHQDWLKQRWAEFDENFAFIANANIGSEFMSDEDVARLEQISQLKWRRTIDDTLGLSWEEKERRDKRPEAGKNVDESVLVDRIDHQLTWSDEEKQEHLNWQYTLPLPEMHLNLGEIYNLSVQRGTLTEEERFIINRHVIESIKMLEQLPYPSYLDRIPEIAGGHHEKLDGKGYPFGLKAEQLSIEARILAICDIFEALTANDRPYKKAKPLSESLNILVNLVAHNHIDPSLLRLFLVNGVYIEYAQKYLPREQCDFDAIDLDALLDKIKAHDKGSDQTSP